MASFILGEKQEQLQTFTSDGVRIPVTYVKTSLCYLVDIKTQTDQGYTAAILGFGKSKKINKPDQGKINKAGIKTPLHFLREFRLEKNKIKIIEEGNKKGIMFGEAKILVGAVIDPLLVFKKGDLVTVTGTAKGKGFQGVVKRHSFRGGPHTHGQSDRERAPGAIGMTTTPGRVFKGKRMAGRMGGQRVTIKNLEIIEIKKDGLLIKGLITGAKKSLLEIRKNDERKKSS